MYEKEREKTVFPNTSVERQEKICTDPFGSYTGRCPDGKPVQDADDL